MNEFNMKMTLQTLQRDIDEDSMSIYVSQFYFKHIQFELNALQ